MAPKSYREVWDFIRQLWEEQLDGTISGDEEPPRHGYKLSNQTLEDAIFVELKAGDKVRKEFKRFYILRHQNRAAFLSKLGVVAKAVEVRVDERRGNPKSGGGLFCDIRDWDNWKAIVLSVLAWAWFRTGK